MIHEVVIAKNISIVTVGAVIDKRLWKRSNVEYLEFRLLRDREPNRFAFDYILENLKIRW